MPAEKPTSPDARLLVIRGGALGDFILTLPAIRLWRRKFPDSRIEVLGYPSIAQLARHWGMADAVAALEHGALAKFFVPKAELDPRWRAYFAGFDFVVSYLFDPDDYFHGNLRRAGVRRLVVGPHKPLNEGPAAALQLAKPFAALGLILREDDAREPFGACGGAKEDVVALHPGSGSRSKNWPHENWREVCRSLSAQTGARFLIVAGEAEHETVGEFVTRLEADQVPCELLDSRPLAEVADRLSTCRLFLGHDSGISHLVAACGVPCVLLFGPTNPAVWAPLSGALKVIAAEALEEIPPEVVISEAMHAWGG